RHRSPQRATASYPTRNAKFHADSYSHAEATLDTKAATDSATTHHTSATSADTTAYCVAATDSAAAHNTSAASAFTTSYSLATTIVRRITNIAKKRSGCEAVREQRSEATINIDAGPASWLGSRASPCNTHANEIRLRLHISP